ncbi:unnamed protein product [Protopolystoma xenopodis]|uniref:Secreted protein n=1 Tax=Protopolystoma xenopodis TaxID=117903 RepID=A0A448WQC2_9PLAT|nr:unnamed protein product [Protopolystoma xenopodis]
MPKRGVLFHLLQRSTLLHCLRVALGHSQDDWLPHGLKNLSKVGSSPEKAKCAVPSTSHSAFGLDRKSISVERMAANSRHVSPSPEADFDHIAHSIEM